MHPDDCAELVAQGVETLRGRAANWQPDLRIEEIRLEERFKLYLTTRVRRYPTTTAEAGSGLVLPGGRLITRQFQVPDLGSRQERVLVVLATCDDFDGQPPLIEVLDSAGQPLAPGDWPRDLTGQGIIANHPKYRRPFFCRPGVREYHEHPQHEDDPWDRHREGSTLDGIVLSVVADLHTRFVV